MRLKLFAIAVLLAGSLTAHADLFTFNFAGLGVNGSGFLSANYLGTQPGLFSVTSISGSVSGVSIDRLLPPGSFLANDNLILQTANNYFPVGNGLAFQLVNGTQFNLSTYRFIVSLQSTNTGTQLTTFQVAPLVTPEPSSVTLLGTGLLGIGAAMRRRVSARRGAYSV